MTKCNSTGVSTPKQAQKRSTKRLTTAEFVDKAIAVHGSVYNYSKVFYKNNRTKVVIICRKHGEFEQTPKDHIKGKGCRQCGYEEVAIKNGDTHSEFIRKAKEKHGSRYSYEKVRYISSTKKVIITCSEHGDFLQTPVSHLCGRGCIKCGIESSIKTRMTKLYASKPKPKPKPKPKKRSLAYIEASRAERARAFIERAREVHGDKYSYEHVNYIRSTSKVLIECPEHGLFEQAPNSHTQGRGCYQCGRLLGGYRRSHFQALCDKNGGGLGILYVIEIRSNGERFVKIGRTSLSIKQRFSGKDMPYPYRVLYEIERKGSYVFDLERRLHSLLENCRYQPKIPFEGQTECFTTIKPIEKLLKELSTTEQLQLLA